MMRKLAVLFHQRSVSFQYPRRIEANCEAAEAKHNDAGLRTRLGGKREKARYRHKSGVRCASTNRSVKREVYERDFERLLQLLTVRTDGVRHPTGTSTAVAQGRYD